MQRVGLVGTTILSLTLSLGGQAGAASLDDIKQRGFATVAVSTETDAFHTLTDGKPAGFDAELLDRLRQFVPFELRPQPMAADDIVDGLKSDRADLAATSLEVTPDIHKQLDFGPPLAETTPYYLERKGDTKIRSVADLSKLPFGVRSGSANFLQLSELEHRIAKAGGQIGTPTEYASIAEASADLASGKIAYVVGALASLDQIVKQQPDAFELGQAVGQKTYVAWAVASGHPDLVQLLKDFVAKERKSGDLASLQQKWLGQAFTDLPDATTAKDWWVARSDKPASLPIPTIKDPD